jgi:hypothetical protein
MCKDMCLIWVNGGSVQTTSIQTRAISNQPDLSAVHVSQLECVIDREQHTGSAAFAVLCVCNSNTMMRCHCPCSLTRCSSSSASGSATVPSTLNSMRYASSAAAAARRHSASATPCVTAAAATAAAAAAFQQAPSAAQGKFPRRLHRDSRYICVWYGLSDRNTHAACQT